MVLRRRQTASVSVVLASASVVVVVVYRLIVWRARSRARKIVERMLDITKAGGPLINLDDVNVRNSILRRAIRRASNWMALSGRERAQPMTGQVGGASIHKRPVLTLAPDYVLKPLLSDHRGFREIAFYESMATVSKVMTSSQAYANFLKGDSSISATPSSSSSPSSSSFTWLHRVREVLDTLAVAFAMILQDQVVMTSEATLKALWKSTKKEAELLHTLCKYTPKYYGVVGQDIPLPDMPFGVSHANTHLLLQDVTSSFSKPCVMDLKMGTQTFEPDAWDDKKQKEAAKYEQQATFGFRIVGMRVYNPQLQTEGADTNTGSDNDNDGYHFFGKEYGRNLHTRDCVKEALRIYFGAARGSGANLANASHGEHDGNNDSSPRHEHGQHRIQTQRNVDDTDNKDDDNSGEDEPSPQQQPRIRIKSVSELMLQLRLVQRWFEDNTHLLFIASSLLLVYEGSLNAPNVTGLKMIDFGRVRRNPPAGDPGYLHGLKTLQQLLGEIIREEEQEQERLYNHINNYHNDGNAVDGSNKLDDSGGGGGII